MIVYDVLPNLKIQLLEQENLDDYEKRSVHQQVQIQAENWSIRLGSVCKRGTACDLGFSCGLNHGALERPCAVLLAAFCLAQKLALSSLAFLGTRLDGFGAAHLTTFSATLLVTCVTAARHLGTISFTSLNLKVRKHSLDYLDFTLLKLIKM